MAFDFSEARVRQVIEGLLWQTSSSLEYSLSREERTVCTCVGGVRGERWRDGERRGERRGQRREERTEEMRGSGML